MLKNKNVVAIGVFDGVHLGHKKILETAVKIARQNHTKAIALTFYPHPLTVVAGSGGTSLRGAPKNTPLSLISLRHRINLIKSFGIGKCVVFNFTKGFARSRPDVFIKDILLKKMKAGWIVVGEDFCFGRRRSGNIKLLVKKGKELGFKVKQVGILKHRGIPISSSLIRQAISSGKLGFAKKILGRPVAVLGTVVEGRRIGRKLGFPTANINPHHEVVPPSGVYAVKVNIDKSCYNGILNIGIRPTFYGLALQDKEPIIEAYIFDFNKSIYGKDVEVVFIKKIRSEKKFRTEKTLIARIEKDIKQARGILCNAM